ncbi:MAG: hypothetical protein IPM29_09705 [Planctomycetes bacterium]|nr:hypothetical protein [Planctomycetota bacterium]
MLLRTLAAAAIAALLANNADAQTVFAVTPYGPSCGPVASGLVTPNGATCRFDFTVTQATPHNQVMVILGVNEQSIPINFGVSCLLLTELAFTQVHMTDTAGCYTWSHALPCTFAGYARIQFADIVFDAQGLLTVRTSNGLYMRAL